MRTSQVAGCRIAWAIPGLQLSGFEGKRTYRLDKVISKKGGPASDLFLTAKAGSKTEKIYVGPFGDIDFDGPTNRPKEVDIDWFEVRDGVLIAGLADRYTSLGSSAPSGEPTRKLLIYDLAVRTLILGQEVESRPSLKCSCPKLRSTRIGRFSGLRTVRSRSNSGYTGRAARHLKCLTFRLLCGISH